MNVRSEVRSAKVFADFSLPRGHGVPQVTPAPEDGGRPSSHRTQLPGAGFDADGKGEEPGVAWAVLARMAAVVLPDRKSRREIRCLMTVTLTGGARL
ncbi:MAG TPA: hypothetical protein VFP37_08300 [Steroidobacteraceae bacterium]|nr:hypothetical protein [Steroidobacteraceae bacterium]